MRSTKLISALESLRAKGVFGSFVGAVVMSLAAVFLLAASAPAADQTWDQASGSWDTTTTNWTGSTWTNGSTAVFGGTAGSTISIDAAGISANGVTFNVTGDTVSASSTNTLSLSSPATLTATAGVTGTISAPLVGTNNISLSKAGSGLLILSGNNAGLLPNVDNNVANWNVNGGGELRITAGTTSLAQTVNLTRSAGTTFIGDTSAGNTVAVSNTGKLITGKTRIGFNSFGGNSMTVSTPGDGTASSNYSVWMVGSGESGANGAMVIGGSSSNNSLTISNGAYFKENTSGTSTWTLGLNAGANNNSISVTGSSNGNPSTLYFTANGCLNVGQAGSGNSMTVSNGGSVRTSRVGIGDGGGSNNYVSVIGTGAAGSATYTLSGTTNNLFEIGSGVGANNNYMSVSAGGLVSITGTGTSRNYSIGGKGQQNAQTAGGDSNYVLVTGANSAFNLSAGLPLALGGTVTGAAPGTITDGGSNNHIDIQNGGAMTLTGTSLYVLGSTATGNTSVNLGDGSSVSTLTVGANASFTAGVLLSNANARLNFNSGRLIAGSSGSLVSGSGQVVLAGPSYVSTTQINSTISSLITGTGSFTKEGTGLLTLNNASNNYTGNTIVSAGTLSLSTGGTPWLSDLANVSIAAGAILDLSFSGTDTVANLFLAGIQQAGGTYGAIGSGATFETASLSGTGLLNVTSAVPEPETLGLLGVGMAAFGFLQRRRRRA